MPMSSSSDLELPDLPETPDTTGAYPRLTDEQWTEVAREVLHRTGVLPVVVPDLARQLCNASDRHRDVHRE